jgi:FKBP-type peptidyl-prolyl cis-trans isomerase (trigger factor)
VPPAVAEKHLDPRRILEDVLRLALEPHLPRLLREHAPRPAAQPVVVLKEQQDASGRDSVPSIPFTLIVPVYPEITLPDYRAIAHSFLQEAAPSFEGEEEAAERALILLRKEHALKARKELNPYDTSTIEDIREEDLPPLTDEVARSLGPFQSVQKLRDALQKDMHTYLAAERTQATREALLRALIAATSFEVPRVFVEFELMRMMEALAVWLAAEGKTLESFLEEQGAQREALLRSWEEQATLRVKGQLILNAIAEQEGVAPDDTHVQKEADAILARNPSLDRQHVESVIRQQLQNEAVFRLLLGGQQESSPASSTPKESEGA